MRLNRTPPALGLLAALSTTACTDPRDPALITGEDLAGACSIGAAAGVSSLGLAAYEESAARVPAGPGASGTRAVAVTCLIPGPQGRLFLLMLPGLRQGQPADTGRYTVRPCGPDRCEGSADPRTAWVEARVPNAAPGLYQGAGGYVHIARESEGVIEGSYQVALARVPSTHPGFPAEQVYWGSFRAPRHQERGEGR